MAVGIGLDHRHDLGLRRDGLDRAEIFPQCADIDKGVCDPTRVSKAHRHRDRE